ncbi:trp operon leader peptide [Citrobacter meridianamericanus]
MKATFILHGWWHTS